MMDFTMAFNCFCLVIVHFANIKYESVKAPIRMILFIVVLSIAYLDRFNVTLIAIVFSVATGLVLLHQMWHLFLHLVVNQRIGFLHNHVSDERRKQILTPLDILSGFVGLVFFVGGYVCQYFANQDGGEDYWFLHALWHVFLAAASLCLFKVRNKGIALPGLTWLFVHFR